mgnify:CR=1 FL=1
MHESAQQQSTFVPFLLEQQELHPLCFQYMYVHCIWISCLKRAPYLQCQQCHNLKTNKLKAGCYFFVDHNFVEGPYVHCSIVQCQLPCGCITYSTSQRAWERNRLHHYHIAGTPLQAKSNLNVVLISLS